MPGKKKRPPILKENTEHNIEEAIKSCKLGMSVRASAKKFSIPRSTLCDRIKGRSSRRGKRCHLDPVDEQKLCSYAQDRATQGFGCTRRSFLRYAGQLAVKRGNPFPKEKPSLKWWALFKRRHPEITLVRPEPTGLARQQAANSSAVGQYFHQLKETLQKLGLSEKPKAIYNMDETGFTLSHRPGKVVCRSDIHTFLFRKHTSIAFWSPTSRALFSLAVYGPPI